MGGSTRLAHPARTPITYDVTALKAGAISAVQVAFNQPVQLIGLTPEQARKFAIQLRQAANALEKGS